MSLTAYIAPFMLSGLSDVSVAPGSGQSGYPLIWDNTLGKWVASLLQISSLTGGPLPLSQGGLGANAQTAPATARANLGLGSLATQNSNALSVTGSIFENHSPEVISTSVLGWTATSSQGGELGGPQNIFRRSNGVPTSSAQNVASNQNLGSISFRGWVDSAYSGSRAFISATATENWATGSQPTSMSFFTTPSGSTGVLGRMTIQATGQVLISASIATTSTTSGSLRVLGGVGVGGAIYNGGNLVSSGTKINFANLPTSETGLAVGDLWRDGNIVKVKI